MPKFKSCFLLLILVVISIFNSPFVSAQEAPKNIPTFLSPEELAKLPDPNIKIAIKNKITTLIKPGEDYHINWIIEGLKEGQEVTHTDIHWSYVEDLKTAKKINDYKNYYNFGREYAWIEPDYYADSIYIPEYTTHVSNIAVFIHAIIEGKDYTLGPLFIAVHNQ